MQETIEDQGSVSGTATERPQRHMETEGSQSIILKAKSFLEKLRAVSGILLQPEVCAVEVDSQPCHTFTLLWCLSLHYTATFNRFTILISLKAFLHAEDVAQQRHKHLHNATAMQQQPHSHAAASSPHAAPAPLHAALTLPSRRSRAG